MRELLLGECPGTSWKVIFISFHPWKYLGETRAPPSSANDYDSAGGKTNNLEVMEPFVEALSEKVPVAPVPRRAHPPPNERGGGHPSYKRVPISKAILARERSKATGRKRGQ